MSRSLLSPGVLEWRLNRKDYENLLFLPTSNPLILFHLFTHNIKHNIFERWKRYDNWKYISYSLYSYHSHRQWAAQRANRMEPEGNHMTSTPFHCEPEASGGDRRETRPGGDEGPLLHRLICLPPHGPGCYHLIWRKPVRDERLLLTTVPLSGPIIPLLLLLVNAVNGWSHPILISLSFLSLSVSEMRDETTRSLRSLNLWWKDEERLSIPWRDRPSSAHPSSRYTLLSSGTRRVTSVVRSEWGADGERVTTIPSHSLPTHDGLFLHFTSLRVERPSWVRQRSGVNEEGTVRVMEAGIRLTFTTRHPSAPLLGVESRSLRVTRKERWRKGITIVPPEPATHALSVYNPFCLNCWVRLKDPEDPR